MAVGDPPDDPLDDEKEPSEPPPASERAARPSEPPGPGRRRRLEGVIPELLKRAIEVGYEKATDMPESLKHLPKEAAGYIFSQVEETKNGVLRVVAKEVRDFLEHTNLAGEMSKVLTTLQFEINTTIRFRPNSGDEEDAKEKENEDGEPTHLPKPEVKLDVYTRRKKSARDDK
jgi:hypothetical protein